ncbi:MAG: iron-sulfur cluster assembly accessory protein [Pseudohongiella sp.]|nr:iron-sulfur cluster assembly accessory protein [Pseudohongiella sp.]MDO9518589.1 iron-sulfur cluster assembly accessory protein [Pseudohongiella sp.]MDP2127205.1 iron-sulfur cluster assembly accessory protein [Pseudohongiella sp.]
MSVKNFDPQTIPATPVSVTPSAIDHFRKQLQKDQSARAVRLSVKESGCTGFMYVIDLVPELNQNDLRQTLDDGVELLIDRGSLNIVNGTQIDLVTEGVNRQLRFLNPNAKDHCGCGESFSVN